MDRNRGFDINALRQQFENLLEDLVPSSSGRKPSGQRGDQTQTIPVNIVETEDATVVSAPLSGFRPDEVEVSIRGNSLSIRAQHRAQAEREGFVRREWGTATQHRSVEVPGSLDADNASAEFRSGVLTVTIPHEKPHDVTVEDDDTRIDEPESDVEGPQDAAEKAAADEVSEGAEDDGSEGEEAGSRPFYMRSSRERPRGRDKRRHSGRSRAEIEEPACADATGPEPDGGPEPAQEDDASAAGLPIEVSFSATSENEPPEVDASVPVGHTTTTPPEDAPESGDSADSEVATGIPDDADQQLPRD